MRFSTKRKIREFTTPQVHREIQSLSGHAYSLQYLYHVRGRLKRSRVLEKWIREAEASLRAKQVA